MVAESNPARQRAVDSSDTTHSSVSSASSSSSTASDSSGSSARRPSRRTRVILAGIALAAVAGAAATPLAADAGVDPTVGIQAMLGLSGTDGGIDASLAAAGSAPSV